MVCTSTHSAVEVVVGDPNDECIASNNGRRQKPVQAIQREACGTGPQAVGREVVTCFRCISRSFLGVLVQKH